MDAQEKRGILTLMAEVVWRPKLDQKAGKEAEKGKAQSTIRPEFSIQRKVSTENLARIPRTLKDIIEDPQHMADFEAYLRELDIDIEKDMCGFLDSFHFIVRIGSTVMRSTPKIVLSANVTHRQVQLFGFMIKCALFKLNSSR